MIDIYIPPEGFLASSMASLTLLFVAKHHRARYLEVRLRGEDTLSFEGDTADFCRSLQAAYHEILEDSPTPAAPKMHQNDRQVLFKASSILGVSVRGDESYTQVFKLVAESTRRRLEDPDVCASIVRELAIMRTTGKTVELGSQTLAPLQVFKLEKYEYGKDYLRLADLKADLRMSPAWLALCAAGWLASYMGNPGTLVYSLPPDEYILKAFTDPSTLEMIMRPGGLSTYWDYFAAPSKARYTNNPPEAYMLYIALTLPLGDLSLETSLPPFRLLRVSFDGRRFTALEDTIMDLSQAIAFAKRIPPGSPLHDAIIRLLNCVLRSYQERPDERCKSDFGDFDVMLRMTKIIYMAAIQSLRPETAVYRLARLSPYPVEGRVPPFRRPRVLRSLLEVLRMRLTGS